MVFEVKNAYFLSESDGKKITGIIKEGFYRISLNFLLWEIKIGCVKYGLFGFLSYGYDDGVALRERVAFLREEELLLVGVGLAVVDAEVEDPLLLSLPNKRE